ncbi:hypothetical protein C7999DRAFT_40892 [Corynascus novoguineensis]|uniref:Bacteriophage T5 Orf172 DNA-binding domain-containing protein n=1 Tax=Corynascus novoguineensis TaxID=1126955 RepID=A0AAN7HJD5_9PEZI|nr:hypothetical protein C7999DRAFT_40892 [Corynascus novoguineensis]
MSEDFSQPTHKATATSFLPSVLTLRIYHEDSSFSAKSTTQLAARGTTEIKCTCSRIPRLWIGAEEVPQLNFALPETPQRTTVLRFVFRTAAKMVRANNLCIKSQKSPGLESFRRRMLKLVTDLAAICEEEHPLNPTKPRPTECFTPFSPFRTSDLDRNTISEELRAKIFNPLAASEVQGQGMGYVYIMRSNLDIDALSVLKIGFSKYHPEHRAHELASCLSAPDVVAYTPLIPHAKRVESLIHAELVANRKHAQSREVVIRWSKWILQQPYIDGKLSEEWRSYLEKQQFISAKPEETMSGLWGDILNGFPRQHTDQTPEDQLAAYLNACYWAAIADRVFGPSKTSFTSFHNTLRDSRKGGKSFEISDFQRALEKACSSSSNLELTPNVITTPERHSQTQPDPSFQARMGNNMRREHKTWEEQLRRQLESIKNLKTGGYSVSDPEQGITESPLGDATLLPVVSLKALIRLDAPARTWIGYNPTHQGFQMLQEAYQRGEWVGNVPEFELPKAFRNAGITTLRTPQGGAADTKGANTPASSRTPHGNKKNAKARETKVEFESGPDGQKFTFSRVIDDDMIREMKELQEIMKFPLGRALVNDQAIRQFRQLGIHTDGNYEAISSSEDSEDGSSDEDDDKMDIDEPEPKRQRPGLTSRSRPGITKAKAKQWLESL